MWRCEKRLRAAPANAYSFKVYFAGSAQVRTRSRYVSHMSDELQRAAVSSQSYEHGGTFPGEASAHSSRRDSAASRHNTRTTPLGGVRSSR